MIKSFLLFIVIIFSWQFSFAQYSISAAAKNWADSVFNTLSDTERISQLMMLRVSQVTANGVVFYEEKVADAIQKYNIGGVVLFQGGPIRQANFINHFQGIAKTPLMVCIDAEWGLGMRFDSIVPLNHQLMLGALPNASIVYQYGKIVGEQCKRAGIQVNYAPVVDINNNPNNPVINDRSFGEDKYKVALFGIQYMKGLQDAGVLACAKHFPGHGDVAVDSHYDLPIINKTKAQLDSLELYPFREMFKAGVGSVMVAHLYIPVIDSTPNRATSVSKNNVTGLLRNELGYQGLTFTDALDMKGVAKFFPGGEIAVESLIAGNDILCLPGDVGESITKINEAISNGRLSWNDIYAKCKKLLAIKYMYGLSKTRPVDTAHLAEDINSKVNGIKKLVAENAITLLNNKDEIFYPLISPSKNDSGKSIAYVGIGISADNAFAKRMRTDYNADIFYFDYKQDSAGVFSITELIKKRYKSVVIGIHRYARFPANNFGISKNAINLVHKLQQQTKAIIFVFGNPYAIKNFCTAPNLVACYEDDDIIQNTAVDFLKGNMSALGKLPVTVCDDYRYGSGIVVNINSLPVANPLHTSFNYSKFSVIDSIANDAIVNEATPGCVVLVAKDGKIAYQKAFGKYDYDKPDSVTLASIYDMASVTKICATTIAVMKLYDEGKIKLNKTLGYYLPWVRGSNKQNLSIENILLHQAGLTGWIPFYKETLDTFQAPLKTIYSSQLKDSFKTRVADNLFLRNDWGDTMYKRILQSPAGPSDKYVYSDNDFIFMGKIVEKISKKSLDEYVRQQFYDPMGLTFTGFKPREKFPLDEIAPTEKEKYFRLQQVHGDVHDPGAAMFGGVAGHAGLFSNVNDLAVIMQMLLNGGKYNGHTYLKEETINLFTSYNSSISRRGFGFDKPEKDNALRPEPYPAKAVSPLTFGHTGFTGTCVWADPEYNLIFIFLSNRVNTNGGDSNKLLKLNVRSKIQEAVYDAMGKQRL
ncbi:MAG: glycoside hydrolase family 3 N-terminal domain-containing protein [Ginsengibacter sp.]